MKNSTEASKRLYNLDAHAIVSEMYFAPNGPTTADRSNAFRKRLVDDGCSVIVLSAENVRLGFLRLSLDVIEIAELLPSVKKQLLLLCRLVNDGEIVNQLQRPTLHSV